LCRVYEANYGYSVILDLLRCVRHVISVCRALKLI
jgi:hypothetical protein